MTAIGMVLILAGYYAGLYGYCLIRGYDVTFTSLAHTSWPDYTVPGISRFGKVAAGAV
jgi:hypothetical protein